MFSRQVGHVESEFLAHPDGHLSLTVRADDADTAFHFQRVKPAQAGIALISIISDNATASCQINSNELRRLDEAKDEVLEFATTPPEVVAPTPVHFTPEVLEQLPRWEWLFLHTLNDIEQKIARGTSYELIRLSGLIRHLILDGNPLADTVRRRYGLKIQYQVIPRTRALPDPENTVLWQCGLFLEGGDAWILDTQEFLGFTVMYYRNNRLSVRDVLDTVAHSLGGVHHGERAKSSKNKPAKELLLAVEQEYQTGNLSLPESTMRDIGRVVLKAMMPLANAIAIKYSTETGG